MELHYISNAPRELSLGGQTYRVRTLCIGDFGEILAWLEDRLPVDPERRGPVLFSSEAAQLALATTEGLAVVLHLACLPCHPGMTRDDARRLTASMTEAETDRLRSIAYRRRPKYGSGGEGAPLSDLAEIRWGEVFYALSGHDATRYDDVARLTLDQYDCHADRGEVAYPDDVDVASLQSMWEAATGKGESQAPSLPADRPIPPTGDLPPERPLPEVIP